MHLLQKIKISFFFLLLLLLATPPLDLFFIFLMMKHATIVTNYVFKSFKFILGLTRMNR